MTEPAAAPKIEALLNADPTGVVIIDGVGHDVAGGDERSLRAEIIALVSATAADAGHPVQLTTRHPGGVRREIVHPDGRVDDPETEHAGAGAEAEVASGPDDVAGPDDVSSDTNEVPTLGSWSLATPPAPWAPPVPDESRAAPAEPGPEPQPESQPEAEMETAPEVQPAPTPGTESAPTPVTDAAPAPAQPSDPAPAVDDSIDEATITRPLGDGAFGVVGTAPVPAAASEPAPVSAPPQELRRPRSHAERISPPPPAPESIAAAPAPAGPEALIQPVEPPPPGVDALSAAAAPVPLLPGTASAEQTLTVRPTLNDFLSTRPAAPSGPATMGWRGSLRRATGNLLRPGPGREEKRHRVDVERVQKALNGPRTIVVINPKGGAHKTTATLLLAATFGRHRGGSTLAWDNNETRGTLGWRALAGEHHRTAVDLLHDLPRFEDPRSSQIGALDNYVRAQGSSQFDVLASDEDAAASSTINASAFTQLHDTLSRFYRVLVVDTGNNMRASNWLAALDAADQLVIVSTKREDTAASAAWLVDGLFEKGYEEKVRQAVTVLASPAKNVDPALDRRLHTHFASVTRAVLDVPYDPTLVSGGTIDVPALSPATREAWLHVAATVADGL